MCFRSFALISGLTVFTMIIFDNPFSLNELYMKSFQRTMGTTILKSSVSLIRKTVHHMSPESLKFLVSNNFSSGPEGVSLFLSGQKLAEGIVNVIVTMLDHEDNIEGQENVLLVNF